MKKTISIFLFLIILLSCFTACNSTENPNNTDDKSNTDDKPNVVEVTAINLSKHSVEMVVDDKQSISATVVPSNATDKNITWKSSDSSVADYLNGKIVAFKVGSCVIIATSSNGKVDYCTVTVNRKQILADSVSFKYTSTTIPLNQNSVTTLSFSPNSLDSYNGTVKSSDPSVLTAKYSCDKNGKVSLYPHKEGTATITVTLENGKSTSAVFKVVDIQKLVKVNLPECPAAVGRYYSSGKCATRAVVVDMSVDLEYIYSSGDIGVTITLTVKKSYDDEGSKPNSAVDFYLDLYKENDVFCEAEWVRKYGLIVDQTFTDTYTFTVAIDDNMTPREFTIKLRDFC